MSESKFDEGLLLELARFFAILPRLPQGYVRERLQAVLGTACSYAD